MRAIESLRSIPGGVAVTETTLLELVCVVGEHAASEAEVVATVVHLVRSGRVRLSGNFRGSRLEDA